MIELKYFSSTFYKVTLQEQPPVFRRSFVFNSGLPMQAGWAQRSNDKWFALYEKDGVLTFRCDAWTCPVDAATVCRLDDEADGSAVFSLHAGGALLFEHRYSPARRSKDRLADDFFAWLHDIWSAKAPA